MKRLPIVFLLALLAAAAMAQEGESEGEVD